MPEKGERARGENALCRVNGYPEIIKAAEYRADVFDVLIGVLGRDEDVVDVREDEIEAGENGVNQPLEGLSGVT